MQSGRFVGGCSRDRRLALMSISVIAVVGMWLTRTFWLPGRFVIGFDTFAYSGPNSEITVSAARAGHLPLINDTIFGGVPHFGNPQTGVLYLPRLLSLIMETNRAMGLVVVAHVLLLGLGMRFFLRRLHLSQTASTVGALTLMASGAVMTKSVQFEQILVLAWLPWLLAVIHMVTVRSLEPGSRAPLGRIGALAVVTAAVCSAGHPQLTYQLAATAIVFWMALLWQGWRIRTPLHALRRSAGAVVSGVTLGFIAVLPQMWAALDATRQSALSSGRSLDALGTSELALTVHRSARAILGTWRSIDPGMFVGSFEPIAYTGVALVLLAVVGVASVRHNVAQRPWILAMTFIGLGTFIMSLGPRTFIFRAAFQIVPGFDFARVSARWLVVLTFALCVLAAVGLDAIASRVDRATVSAIAIAIGGGSAYIIGTTTPPDAVTSTMWGAMALVVLGLVAISRVQRQPPVLMAVLACLALTETFAGSVSSLPQQVRADTPFTEAQSPLTEWLADQKGYTIALTADFGPLPDVIVGLRPNANTLNGIRSIDGYDGGVQITRRWADALRRFHPEPNANIPLRANLEPPIDTRIAARTGIHHLVVDRTRFDASASEGWDGPIRSEGVFDVYRNPSWRGEALAWPAARTLERDAINDVLRDDADSVADLALVETKLRQVANVCVGPCSVIRWESERTRPERIVVSGTAHMPSLVTYPVQAGPGWRATVDGATAPIVVLDALYLGVEVPAGRHTVVFEYRPEWLIPTFILALVAWILIVILLALPGWTSLRRRYRPADPAEQVRYDHVASYPNPRPTADRPDHGSARLWRRLRIELERQGLLSGDRATRTTRHRDGHRSSCRNSL